MRELFKAILYTPLFNILIFLVWLIPGHNVGLAIILLTILIRLALVPSTNKSYKAQKEMRDIQPKMDEIKAKYSKEEQAQKIMELYKEHNVNPMGSCLPLLIQMPIIWVLWRVFQDGLNTNRFDLLYSFMPRPDAMNTLFLGIDLSKPEKFILPAIVGILQLVQMWQLQNYTGMNKKKTDGSQPDMATMMSKQMMYLTPVMTFLISFRLPAALPLYWGVTTLFTIIQQWWFFEKGHNLKFEASNLKIATDNSKPENSVIQGQKKELTATSPIKAKESKKFKSRNKDVVVTVRRKNE